MKLDDVRKLQQKKFREALGHFLVEGEHLVLELQKAARDQPALRASSPKHRSLSSCSRQGFSGVTDVICFPRPSMRPC